MQFRAIFATTFILCTYFAALPKVLADAAACYDTYTDSTAECSILQNYRDTQTWNVWDTNNDIATATLNSYLAQDLTNFNNSINQCQTNCNNANATCQTNYNVAAAAAWVSESNQLAACQSQYADDNPLLYVCVCPDVAAYNYSNAVAQANYGLCGNSAEYNYGNNFYGLGEDGLCVGTAYATKAKSDSSASAGYNAIIGENDAICDATRTVSDNFTTALCNDEALTYYDNCLFDVDCGQTPANCCVDGCDKTYNNSLLSAYSTYLNTVGPATYTYTYWIEMCSVNQQEWDAVAQYSAQFTIDNAFTTKIYAEGIGLADYNFAIAMDAATASDTIAICSCNSGGDTNDTQYVACAAQAIATQTNNDASALAAWDQIGGRYVYIWTNGVDSSYNIYGSATITYNTTRSNALATAQATYTADYSQMTNCVANTQTTLNSIVYAANVQYENDSYAAYQALENCQQGCNGG